MSQKIIISILISIPFIFMGVRYATENKPTAEQTETQAQTATADTTDKNLSKPTNLSQSKGGIDVSIINILQNNQTTTLSVSLSNHQYDLSMPNIYETATLNESQVISYQILQNNMGGHHVEAELVFPREDVGAFVISPADGEIFNFQIL